MGLNKKSTAPERSRARLLSESCVAVKKMIGIGVRRIHARGDAHLVAVISGICTSSSMTATLF